MKLNLEERINLHRRMAESYFNAYSKKVVKDGATYEEWKFSDDATYWSPYFGNELINLKTKFAGHTKEGKEMSFFAYGFVETNEEGEIIHWETHVSEDYSAFLEVAIGVRGPFRENAQVYMEAVAKALARAGVNISLF